MVSARCRYGSCIISFLAVLLICIGSAFADEGASPYVISSDTRVVSTSSDRSTGSWSAFDYGVYSSGAYSTVAITNNEDFWLYTNHSVARGFADLYGRLDYLVSTALGQSTSLNDISYRLTTLNTNASSILSKLWGTASSTYTIYHVDSTGQITSDAASNLGSVLSYSSLNGLYAGYWAKQNNDALWSLAGGLNTANSGIAGVNSTLSDIDDMVTDIDTVFLRRSGTAPSSFFLRTSPNSVSEVNNPAFLRVKSTGEYFYVSASNASDMLLSDYLTYINRNLVSQSSMLYSLGTEYSYTPFIPSTQTVSSTPVYSVMDVLTSALSDLSSGVNRLSYVFASDDDIQAREDADPLIQQAQDDFISSDGSASVKLGDMWSAKDVSAQLQDSMNTGVTPSTAFSYFRPNGRLFELFTQDIADQLDTVPVTRSSDPIVDLYSENFALIGVGDNAVG